MKVHWARGAFGEGRGEGDQGERLARGGFEAVQGPQVPGRRFTGQLVADLGAPVERLGRRLCLRGRRHTGAAEAEQREAERGLLSASYEYLTPVTGRWFDPDQPGG